MNEQIVELIIEWYRQHPSPPVTLATQPIPAFARRAVRVACYAQFLRVVEA